MLLTNFIDSTVQVALIAAAASVITAAVTFILNKKAERKEALQQRKLKHYHELLSAISDLAIEGSDMDEANKKFCSAVNTIALVAPQSVISALMDFHDEIKFSNSNSTWEGQNRKLKTLLLEVRKSLELPFGDNPNTFNFHLVGSRPKQNKAKC